MAILAGDIKLVASRVMDDVPEGGGGPTSTEITDGASNEIFSDISEVARAGGQVSLRKVFVSVQTDDVDTLLDANVIVAVPPQDPNVSVTLFVTGDTFDDRDDARARLEAYLNVGGQYAGYLFGNHIAGQSVILVWQKTNFTPAISETLVLTKREGFSDQVQQYVRVTTAAVEQRSFEDQQGTYLRYVLTLGLSDPLRSDFAGFDVNRVDPSQDQVSLKTKVSDTVVANAGKYYSVVPLEEPASIGDLNIKATTLFTQLVPSAQVETPIADARTNQVSAALTSTGGAVVQSLTMTFTTAASMFVGGGILPGSLSVVRDGITVTDTGGVLFAAAVQVGAVDYENGILSLSTNVFGGAGGTHAVTYTPAAVPQSVSQARGFNVTVENRSLSYVRTIEPPPLRASLQISYRSGGRWYSLQEDGSGAIRGSDSSLGSGTLNYTTGTVVVTLGALPDADSAIIFTYSDPQTSRDSEDLVLDNDGKMYWPINSDGVASLTTGGKGWSPASLTFSWNDGTARTATDDGAGAITGAASGTVDYAHGTARLSPTLLPAPGTNVQVTSIVGTPGGGAVALTPVSGHMTGNLGTTGIDPGSVSIAIAAPLMFTYQGGSSLYWGTKNFRLVDDGAGVLNLQTDAGPHAAGTVDYATGDISINSTLSVTSAEVRSSVQFDNPYLGVFVPEPALYGLIGPG